MSEGKRGGSGPTPWWIVALVAIAGALWLIGGPAGLHRLAVMLGG